MGRRGPKPQPTALKLERGNPGKRPLNAEEPELPPPSTAATKPPKELKGLALAEWNLQVDTLIERGVLTTADMYAFRQYCTLVGEVDALERKLAKGTTKWDDERLKLSTYLLKLRNRLAQQSAALGLTPSARSAVKAVKVPTKDAKQERLGRFFGSTGT